VNPTYCGIIISNYLPGEVIEGKHPPIISKELFFKANDEQLQNRYGQRQQKEREEFPLKQFVHCDQCTKPLTAYHVKGKKATYYKCNTPGCKMNQNTEILHDAFIDLLADYRISNKAIKPIHKIMVKVFHSINKSNSETSGLLKNQLRQVENNIQKLTDKFISDQINKAVFDEANKRYATEKQKIEARLGEQQTELSNLDEYINFTLKISSKLPSMWELSDLRQKQKLQNLIFPGGLRYQKEKKSYRTLRIHSFFDAIAFVSGKLEKSKSGIPEKKLVDSACVAERILSLRESSALAREMDQSAQHFVLQAFRSPNKKASFLFARFTPAFCALIIK
jgi:hypothetical protein